MGCCAACGLVHFLTMPIMQPNDDILLQLNTLEILPSLARVPRGCAMLFGDTTAACADEQGSQTDAPFSTLLRIAASKDPCLTYPAMKAAQLIVQRALSHLDQK